MLSQKSKKKFNGKIHVAYITKGSKDKVISMGFSSDAIGKICCDGYRAPSKHAEVVCLHNKSISNIVNNKLKMNNVVLTSLAFSVTKNKDDDDNVNYTLHASCGKPCKDCTGHIMRKNISKVRYSDDSNDIIKIKTKELMKVAEYSLGFRLTRDLIIITPRLYIRNERTFNLLQIGRKTVEVRLLKGFINSLISNTSLLITHKTKTILMHINKIRRYSSFHNLLKKEGIDNVLPDHNLSNGLRHLKSYWYHGKYSLRHDIVAISLYLAK